MPVLRWARTTEVRPQRYTNRTSGEIMSALGALLFSALTLCAAVDHWPQFRGPQSAGLADDPNLPETWSATQNVAWKTEIPGSGWSSPVVWGNKIFVTSAISAESKDPPKKGLYFGGE